jgi:hypothetical protein
MVYALHVAASICVHQQVVLMQSSAFSPMTTGYNLRRCYSCLQCRPLVVHLTHAVKYINVALISQKLSVIRNAVLFQLCISLKMFSYGWFGLYILYACIRCCAQVGTILLCYIANIYSLNCALSERPV